MICVWHILVLRSFRVSGVFFFFTSFLEFRRLSQALSKACNWTKWMTKMKCSWINSIALHKDKRRKRMDFFFHSFFRSGGMLIFLTVNRIDAGDPSLKCDCNGNQSTFRGISWSKDVPSVRCFFCFMCVDVRANVHWIVGVCLLFGIFALFIIFLIAVAFVLSFGLPIQWISNHPLKFGDCLMLWKLFDSFK